MRKLLIPLAASAALAMWSPVAASAASQDHRQDAYYQVHCIVLLTGDEILSEAVDAHAIEQGGKAGAIANFSQHYPFGYSCWAEGPIQP